MNLWNGRTAAGEWPSFREKHERRVVVSSDGEAGEGEHQGMRAVDGFHGGGPSMYPPRATVLVVEDVDTTAREPWGEAEGSAA
jgi:hypothetical protein